MRFFRFIISQLFLFCLLSLSAQSPPRQIGAGKLVEVQDKDSYTLQLSSIFENSDGTFIFLSDGTVWQQLRTIHNLGWIVGDQILIQNNASDGWVLENTTYNGSANVQFVRLASQKLPKINQVSSGGGIISLDDGSEWTVSWWNRWNGFTWSWKHGDKIIISPLRFPVAAQSHLLINLDQNQRSTTALLIKKPR